MNASGNDLHAEIQGQAGIIVLDRPKARNALTLEMVEAMTGALNEFLHDDDVTSVVVKSTVEGTFCAGGDVRAVSAARALGDHDTADRFFECEFALNALIASFPKPYVAFIDGNCFGGGMGISIHGLHRILGSKAVLAMPETAIGYFPDVGASYFLNRMQPALARFVGLTGYPLSVGDALFTGLATAYVPSQAHVQMEAGLKAGTPFARLLVDLAEDPGESRLARHMDIVEHCFSRGSVREIMETLDGQRGDFAVEALAKLEYAAPSSLQETIALLQRCAGLPLSECLQVELDLAKRMTRAHDFSEGIRALLLDKDRNPRWSTCGEERVHEC